MPSSIICSGLIVDTALGVYIPSGIAQHDSRCVWILTIALLLKERELVLNRVLNFNLCTTNFHMEAEVK